MKHKIASLLLRPQEHIGDSKLSAPHDWVGKRLAQNSALMPDELCVKRDKRNLIAHRSTFGWILDRLSLSHTESLITSEHQRPEIAQARELRVEQRRSFFSKA